MFEFIKKYLQRIGIEYNILQAGRALDFQVDSPEGQWACLISVYESTGVGIYSLLPENIEKSQRSHLALFITMLNNERLLGNFEMDLRSGDLRFKTYLDCSVDTLSELQLEKALLVNLSAMQKHLPQFRQLIEKRAEAEAEEEAA